MFVLVLTPYKLVGGNISALFDISALEQDKLKNLQIRIRYFYTHFGNTYSLYYFNIGNDMLLKKL